MARFRADGPASGTRSDPDDGAALRLDYESFAALSPGTGESSEESPSILRWFEVWAGAL